MHLGITPCAPHNAAPITPVDTFWKYFVADIKNFKLYMDTVNGKALEQAAAYNPRL